MCGYCVEVALQYMLEYISPNRRSRSTCCFKLPLFLHVLSSTQNSSINKNVQSNVLKSVQGEAPTPFWSGLPPEDWGWMPSLEDCNSQILAFWSSLLQNRNTQTIISLFDFTLNGLLLCTTALKSLVGLVRDLHVLAFFIHCLLQLPSLYKAWRRTCVCVWVCLSHVITFRGVCISSCEEDLTLGWHLQKGKLLSPSFVSNLCYRMWN